MPDEGVIGLVVGQIVEGDEPANSASDPTMTILTMRVSIIARSEGSSWCEVGEATPARLGGTSKLILGERLVADGTGCPSKRSIAVPNVALARSITVGVVIAWALWGPARRGDYPVDII
jgi:hypothetical protein